jgi:hypothetical protein
MRARSSPACNIELLLDQSVTEKISTGLSLEEPSSDNKKDIPATSESFEELLLDIKKPSSDKDISALSEPSYVYFYQPPESKQYFLLTDKEGDIIDDEEMKKHLFKINYRKYLQSLEHNTIRINPILNKREIAIGAVTADGGWQMACALTATLALPGWEIGNQFAFPAAISLIAGVVKALYDVRDYEKDHGVPAPPEVKKAIYKECAVFAGKIAIAMGAWELGFFIGQCIITACSLTPHTLWIPAIFAIAAGIFQAIGAVTNQILDEKRKFGYVKSSNFDLAKIFLTNFVSGAIWQLCSYIPFGSLLAKTLIKPVAKIVGSILIGIATAAHSYIINKLTPPMLTSTVRLLKLMETRYPVSSPVEKTPSRRASLNEPPKKESISMPPSIHPDSSSEPLSASINPISIPTREPSQTSVVIPNETPPSITSSPPSPPPNETPPMSSETFMGNSPSITPRPEDLSRSSEPLAVLPSPDQDKKNDPIQEPVIKNPENPLDSRPIEKNNLEHPSTPKSKPPH